MFISDFEAFISFSCLIAVAGTSSAMLNEGGKCSYLLLIGEEKLLLMAVYHTSCGPVIKLWQSLHVPNLTKVLRR